MSPLALVPAALAVVAAPFLVYLLLKRRSRTGASPSPDGSPGRSFRLRASFIGFKRVPLLAVAHNNLNPLLILDDTEFVGRVFRRRRRPYTDIARVGFSSGPLTRNVTFELRDSALTFCANIRTEEDAVAALRILDEKGCPLAPAARALIDARPPD